MQCLSCSKPLEHPGTARRAFCDAKCRGRYWREKREQDLTAALKQIEGAVAKIRRAVWGERDAD